MILTGKIFLMFLDWPFLSTVKVNINWILNSPITISLTYFILKLLCTMNKSSIMTPTAERSGSLPVQELGWFKILLWILYSIIFALGITGNACVCYILHRKQTLRTVTNFFILNVAISDFIFSLSIPLEFPLIVSKFKWPYASFFCKIYTPVQTIAFSVSIFTLTAVSIIRYRAIKHPFKLQVSLSHAHYIVIGIWFLSSLLMVPHVLTLKIKGNRCDEEWPIVLYKKMYTMTLFMFFYVIPLSIISFTYTTIVKELRRKRNFDNSALTEAWHKETSKIVRMFLKVTVVFAVCNLPSQLMWLWFEFGNSEHSSTYFWDVLSALDILVFGNSAANPFIYYLCHDRFRNEVTACLSNYDWLKRLRHCCGRIFRFQGRQESLGVEVNDQEVSEFIKLDNTNNKKTIFKCSNLKMLNGTQETNV